MLQLQIDDATTYKLLTARVQELLIPSDIVIDLAYDRPKLIDGKTVTEGSEAINSYLDELEKFTKQWYACRCDMFP